MSHRSICRTALVALGAAMVLSLGVSRTRAEEKAPPRAAKPNLKGTELYCSYDKEAKKWQFALLPGTNGLKSPKQVKAALTIVGVDELKKKLAKIAEGEMVFPSGLTLGSAHGLDAKTYKTIGEFCKSKKIFFR